MHRALILLGPHAARDHLAAAVRRANPDVTGAEAESIAGVLVDELVSRAADEPLSLAETERELLTARLAHGYALFKNDDPAGAIEQYRAVLAADPLDYSAHWRISELVVPDFDGEHRETIDQLFARANAAYRHGTLAGYQEMSRIALEILELDPNDGMAHRMYAVSRDYVARAQGDARRGGPNLIGPIDTPEERTALVGHFETLLAGAGGTPTDLFPDWYLLDGIQRATVAYSVLPYADFLPAALANESTYHLVPPGTSNSTRDPENNPGDVSSAGRHYYTIRGWQRGNFIVTGMERLDGAARGSYNTVTHEVAHLVHRSLEAAAEKRDEDGVDALTPQERRWAEQHDQLVALYREATRGENGQRLLDAYSGRTIYEYFAQGVMSYVNPVDRNTERSRNLFSRNPKLWHFAGDFVRESRSYPPGTDVIDHDPVGVGASGTPFELGRLRRESPDPAVRAAATVLLEQWEALYNPREGEPPSGSRRRAREEALIERAGELALSDRGLRPANFLNDPAAAVTTMSRAEVRAQLQLELSALRAAGGDAALEAQINEALRGGGDDLDVARARLLELHRAVSALVAAS